MAAATGSIQVDAAGGSFDSATNPEFVINDGTNTFTSVIDNDARGVDSSATQLSDAYAGKLHVPTLDEADGATNALIAVNLHKMGMWWSGNSGNTDPTIVLTDASGQTLSLTYAQPGSIPSGTRIAGNSGSGKNNVYRTDANNYILHQRNTTDSGATHNLLFYWAIKYAYENDGLGIRPYIVTNSSGGLAEPAVGGTSSGYYSIVLKSTTAGFLGNTCNIKVTGTIDDNYLQTSGTDGSGGTIGYFYEEYADSSVYNRTAGYMAQLAGVSGGVYFKNGTIAGSGSDAALSAANIAEAIKVMIDSDLIGISATRSDATVNLTNDTDGTGGNQTITKNVAANSLLTLSGMSGGSSGSGGGSVAANRLTEYGQYIVMERVSGSQSPTSTSEGGKVATANYANAGFLFYSGSSESTSKFFSVMGSGSVAREVVHQLDTFTGSVVLPGSEKVEFNGAGSGEQIFSSTGGQLDIDADTLIEVTAPTIELAGATKVDIQSDAVHFGENGDTDVVLTFNANSADGELKWMEDEDYFEFSDDVLLASDEKLQFRDTAIYVHSSADGQLDLAADGAVSVDAGGDIVLDADGGEIEFRDGGVLIGALSNSSSDLILSSSQADKDIKFQGNDGGSGITALTLDMSEAGKATFNSSVEVTNAGSFIIGSADMNEADLEKLDGITNGTAEAGKAVVLDADLSIGTIQNLTASFAKIGTLDVDVINSVTKTESTLEVEDKLIISSLSASAANSDGGGLQIGSKEGATDYAAAVLYDHQGGSTPSLTFRIAGSTRTQVRSTGLHPGANNATSLGLSSLSWSDLFLGDGAVVNFNNGDVTMTHSSNLLTVTGGNTRVDRLEIDGASDYIDVDTDLQVIAAADILLDPAGGEVKVDGNLVPNSDSSDELGASGTAWSALYVDSIDLAGQGDISMGGTGRIDLDADDDTSIRASADDVITLEVGGSDKLHLSATALYANADDDVALGSLHKGFSDLFLAAGAVVNFNNDTTLTHVSGSGLLLSDDSGVGTDKLMFGDSATYIHQAADGQLDAVADSVIQVTAPTVNIEASTAITLESDSVTFGEGGSSNIQLDFNTAGNDGTLTWVVGSDHFLFSDDVSIAQNEKLKFGSDNEHISANGAGQISLVGGSHITINPGNASNLYLGADGAGKDVYFYGGASNEQILYDASDHQLKVTDSSGALQLTIGGDDSAEFAIDVSQATSNSGKIRATAFVTYSDETLKTNIKPMNNAMDTVMKLQGVNFDWKNDGASDFGFIAQDLQKVIPQAVSSADTEDGVMGVDYSRLTAVLVEAMKAQQTEIETLKSAIAKLSK